MSSTTYLSTLHLAARLVTIFLCIPIFAAGILGNILIIIVFLSLKTFRENSCAFYLLIMSISNLTHLLTSMLTRIVISGFDIDWMLMSVAFCKIRNFSLQYSAVISSTCLCLATIDQYLATCFRPHWQQWSSIKLTRRLALVFIIFWLIDQIPTLIFYEHVLTASNTIVCTIINPIFSKFNMYFNQVFLWTVVSLFLTSLFGILSFYNIKHLAYRTIPLVRRELDKQLTTMVLVQCIFNILALVPSITIHILNLNETLETDKTKAAQIYLSYTSTVWLYYLYYAVSLEQTRLL